MDGAHKVVAQVRKRQRTHKQNAFGAIGGSRCVAGQYLRSDVATDSLVGELSTAAEQLAEAPGAASPAACIAAECRYGAVVETLQALQQRVTERKLQQQLVSDQKQYHAAVSKLGKTISKVSLQMISSLVIWVRRSWNQSQLEAVKAVSRVLQSSTRSNRHLQSQPSALV